MKGLILKDILCMKSQLKYFLICFGVYIIIFSVQGSVAAVGTFSILLVSIFTSVCASFDESCKWNRYAITLPYPRCRIVEARYLGLFIFSVGMNFLCILIGVISALIRNVPIDSIFSLNIIFCCIALLLIALMLPVLYRFGATKARFITMLFVMLPAMGISFISVFDFSFLSLGIPAIPANVLLLISAAITIGIYFLSYKLSVKIYNKREF